MLVERLCGGADSVHEPHRPRQGERSLPRHEDLERLPVHVLEHHGQAVRKAVDGLHSGKPRLVNAQQRAPEPRCGESASEVLAHEEASPTKGHELGPEPLSLGKHPLDLVGVVQHKGVQHLSLVHASALRRQEGLFSHAVELVVAVLAAEPALEAEDDDRVAPPATPQLRMPRQTQ